MKSHFQTMARYNRWANARLYAAAAALPDALYREDIGLFFRSLHGTLNHLLATDRIWMRRIDGTGEAPDRLNAILFEEFAALREARRAEDERIVRFIEGLRDGDLAAILDYKTTRGVPQRDPLGQVLAHLFNHQTHHRGQAHTALSQLTGAEPPPLDLLVMLREQKA
ncbi:MAG: DinB family protein [Burkholderiales bacterium]